MPAQPPSGERSTAPPGTILAARETQPAGWVTTAGEAVGLIAGAVALVYLLGGLVFASRLVLDAVSVPATAAIVGQMSRELLITTGFVQVLAPAALVGLAAGLIYGAATGLPGRPDEPQGAHSGTKWPRLWTRNRPKVPTELTLVAIPLGFAVPALALVDQDLSTTSTMLVVAGLVAYAWVVAVAVWRVGRRSAEDRLAGRLGHQRPWWKPTSTWLRLLAIALGLALPSLLVLTLAWPLLEAVGTAAAVAAGTWILLIAGRVLGPQVGEKRLANRPEGAEPAPILTHGLPTWIALLPLAALLASPGAFLLFGEGRQSWVELAVVAAGIIVNWAALAVCWYALRTVVPARARDGKTRHRAGRGLSRAAVDRHRLTGGDHARRLPSPGTRPGLSPRAAARAARRGSPRGRDTEQGPHRDGQEC